MIQITLIYYVLLLFLMLIFVIQLFIFYKIKWVLSEFHSIKSYGDNLFRQNECLIGIYKELDFKKSLPLTRGWAGSPDFLWHLSQYVLSLKPKVVVECSSGVSTVVISRCLQINNAGMVYSLENEMEFLTKTKDNLKKHDLLEFSTLMYSPLIDYELNNENWP